MKENFVILVDIDCILDTRLGTLVRLNPAKAAVIAANGYKTSSNDQYGDLTDSFNALYADRDVDTLMVSTVTEVPLQMTGVISDIYKWNTKNPVKKDVKIYLNIHPYDLSDRDIEEMVRQLDDEMLYDDIDIVPIRLDMSTLTPAEAAKHDVHVVFTQEPDIWMASLMDQDVLPNSVFKEVTCVSPRTLRNIDKDQVDKIDLEHKDGPFKTMEFYFSGFLEMLLIEPSIFRAAVLNKDYVQAGVAVAKGDKPDLSELVL